MRTPAVNKLVILAMLGVAPLALASPARSRVQREYPGFRWHHVLRVDLDCDGTRDDVFTARRDGRFHVSFVVAKNTGIVSFALEGDSEDSFCGPPQWIAPEPLEDDPRCLGLVIETGDCDRFHLYWDSDAKALAWWRN
jgi:hypothetical protein